MKGAFVRGYHRNVFLEELFHADTATGKLVWAERSVDLFRKTSGRSAAHAARQWNDRYAGTLALNYLDDDGYLSGRIFKKVARSHRVLWAMHTGEWPKQQIDHINGVRDDNRIENLRDVSPSTNSRNTALKSNNKSGHVGVCFDSSRGKWLATANKKFIGRFDKIEDAILARKQVAEKFNFTERHGK